MLFVTFHGGSGKGSVNNVYAYTTGSGLQTTPLSTAVLNVVYPDLLSELRGMVFANDFLYVANGSKKTSNVLCFSGSGTTYNPVGVFICGSVESINHPFAVLFDNANHCYVSNQDTNVVAIFNVNASGAAATAAAVASYLTGLGVKGTFLDATFVASKNGDLPNVPPAPSLGKGQGGLDVSFSGSAEAKDLKVQNSVRDLAIANGVLLVVDEPGNCIRMYNPSSGQYLGKSGGGPLISPTHLAIANNNLYVSGGGTIWSSALPASSTSPTLDFSSAFTTTLGDVAGFAFDGASPPNCYVAIRTKNPQILLCGPGFTSPATFVASPPDAPEFVMYVPD